MEIPMCEFCQSPMNFVDSWVEDVNLIIAVVECTNKECLNTSIMIINAEVQNLEKNAVKNERK